LVLAIADGYLSRRLADGDFTWHKWNGYAVLTLIVFRVIWGFVGGSTARFGSFFPTPIAMWRYGTSLLHAGSRRYLGHNPLGAVMVLALLIAVLAQGLTGLFNTDDILFDGPFVKLASDRAVRLAGIAHHYIWQILLVLMGLHLAANLFYRFVKREPLIEAMVTGSKPADDYLDAAQARGGSSWLALACLVIAAALVLGTVRLLGGAL
jgi:cytochrome b